MANTNSMMVFQRGTTEELNKIDILNGQILLDTKKKQILVDESNKRIVYAGKENASDIFIGEGYEGINYKRKDGRVVNLNIDSDEYVSNIIFEAMSKIVDLSERVFATENAIANIQKQISGGELKDYIKKTDLVIDADSNGNLTITKKY